MGRTLHWIDDRRHTPSTLGSRYAVDGRPCVVLSGRRDRHLGRLPNRPIIVIASLCYLTTDESPASRNPVDANLLDRLPVWRVMLVASSDVQPFYERFEFAPYPDVIAQLNWDKLFDLPTDRGDFVKDHK